MGMDPSAFSGGGDPMSSAMTGGGPPGAMDTSSLPPMGALKSHAPTGKKASHRRHGKHKRAGARKKRA